MGTELMMRDVATGRARRGPAAPPSRVLWWVFAAVLVIGALVCGTFRPSRCSPTRSAPRSSVHRRRHPGLDVATAPARVRVVAADGDEIEVTAEISEGLRATGESPGVVGDMLELRGTCPDFGSDWCRVSYDGIVPTRPRRRRRRRRRVGRLVGVTGAVDVDGDNGAIDLDRPRRRADAANDNGADRGVRPAFGDGHRRQRQRTGRARVRRTADDRRRDDRQRQRRGRRARRRRRLPLRHADRQRHATTTSGPTPTAPGRSASAPTTAASPPAPHPERSQGVVDSTRRRRRRRRRGSPGRRRRPSRRAGLLVLGRAGR